MGRKFCKSVIENYIAVELKSEAFLFFQYRESVIHLLCSVATGIHIARRLLL